MPDNRLAYLCHVKDCLNDYFVDRIKNGIRRPVVWEDIHQALKDVPTVDAIEVVHGYNVDHDYPSLFECSVCGWSCSDTVPGDTEEYNYCPNCGARMDADIEDGDGRGDS